MDTEGLTFNPEGAVHLNPKKPRNRGQETMPWSEIMAIADATVFIKGESHAGTGTLIEHDRETWLLTANSVLRKNDVDKDKVRLYFGYIDKVNCGDEAKPSDVLDPKRWYSHDVELMGFNYTLVGVHKDKLSKVLNKEKKNSKTEDKETEDEKTEDKKTEDRKTEDREIQLVSWEFEPPKLERFDHLYIVHYPEKEEPQGTADPEEKIGHRRFFGGDVIQGTEGAFIYCSMSAWDGSEGAPLFMTKEETGKPQLVGIINYSQESTKKGVAKDESVTNVGCNISYIKEHVHSRAWDEKDTPRRLKVEKLH